MANSKIQLGQIVYDAQKGQINLELTSMIEDNLTQKQDRRVSILWGELAEIIELGMKQYTDKELKKCK